MVILPATEKKMLSLGQSWSNLKVFSFRMLGSKSYEKIYTLNTVNDVNNRQVAIVDMNAIPSSEMAEKLKEEQSITSMQKMFDSTGTYSGRLVLDTTNGKVENYSEKLQSEWVIVDPSAKQTDSNEPATLKMQSIRVYSIEKIN